jgi:hypothetical protein
MFIQLDAKWYMKRITNPIQHTDCRHVTNRKFREYLTILRSDIDRNQPPSKAVFLKMWSADYCLNNVITQKIKLFRATAVKT